MKTLSPALVPGLVPCVDPVEAGVCVCGGGDTEAWVTLGPPAEGQDSSY